MGFKGLHHASIFIVRLELSDHYPAVYGVRSRIGASAPRWEQRFNHIDLTLVGISGELKLLRWMLALIVITTVIPVLQGLFTLYVLGS